MVALLTFFISVFFLPNQTNNVFAYIASAESCERIVVQPIKLSELEACLENYKFVALTFDDGPHYKYTPIILDSLSKYDAKATFFVIGNRLSVTKDLVRRIVDEGHAIGNHTYNHKQLTQLNTTSIKSEIEKTNDEIEEIAGIKSTIIRPPTGKHNKYTDEIIKEEGLSIILWNLDTADWLYKDAKKIT